MPRGGSKNFQSAICDPCGGTEILCNECDYYEAEGGGLKRQDDERSPLDFFDAMTSRQWQLLTLLSQSLGAGVDRNVLMSNMGCRNIKELSGILGSLGRLGRKFGINTKRLYSITRRHQGKKEVVFYSLQSDTFFIYQES